MKPSLNRTRKMWFVVLALSLPVLPGQWVEAADKVTTPPAPKPEAEAATAMASGDYEGAIELYRAMWTADPQPETMLQLARAEHLDGQMEMAFEHYRAYLANPGSPIKAERIEMAERFAGEIARLRLDMRVQKVYSDASESDMVMKAQFAATEEAREVALLQQAQAAERSGDQKTAASLYLGAYRPARDRNDLLLFKAALEDEYAREWPVAINHLEEYLKRASPDAPTYYEASVRLETLRRRIGKRTDTAAAEAPVVVPQPPQSSTILADVPRDDAATIGWSLVTVGAAVALVGVGSYIWTYSQQASPGANGESAADARAESLHTHAVTSLILGGVGVATAGVGTYLILKTPARIALAPGPVPAGLTLAGRF
jgi:tetratricopeptide (TPR) repeat protein